MPIFNLFKKKDKGIINPEILKEVPKAPYLMYYTPQGVFIFNGNILTISTRNSQVVDDEAVSQSVIVTVNLITGNVIEIKKTDLW